MIDFSRTTILFGGSFDPIHAGHLHVAKHALAALPGAQLVFVPAQQSPGKHPPVASPAERLAWLEKAVAAGIFQVWDAELKRDGVSYTVDTLLQAHGAGARRENLYWLVGADAYATFPAWKDPARIRALAKLLVVNRPGSPIEAQDAEDLIVEIPPHPASSTALRAALAAGQEAPEEIPAPVNEELGKLLLLGRNPYARGISK
ncbi:MAG: nicotinate (nicotinamide) nucleotide adenylyltransferase [Proteobacteria bacterium]|nr:MAG: nicotinate (nicotinamide) nucleotide adenylyltransferase [Pseudomonadota bacterium]